MVTLSSVGLRSTYRSFSDEAHFDLGGYVNKQNSHIWGTENLHTYIAKSSHSKRVTVWCGFWSRVSKSTKAIGVFMPSNNSDIASSITVIPNTMFR